MRIITVVIGAESGAKRFSESASLLDWAYANYENKKIFTPNQELDAVNVKKGKTSLVSPILKEGYSCVVKKGGNENITTKIEINDSITAPLKKGDKIGVAYVLKDNVVIKEIDIITNTDVKKLTYLDAIKDIISKY